MNGFDLPIFVEYWIIFLYCNGFFAHRICRYSSYCSISSFVLHILLKPCFIFTATMRRSLEKLCCYCLKRYESCFYHSKNLTMNKIHDLFITIIEEKVNISSSWYIICFLFLYIFDLYRQIIDMKFWLNNWNEGMYYWKFLLFDLKYVNSTKISLFLSIKDMKCYNLHCFPKNVMYFPKQVPRDKYNQLI